MVEPLRTSRSLRNRLEDERGSGLLLTPEEYINDRVEQYMNWYKGKAVVAKRRYQSMSAVSVVGAATVPVLVNLSFPYVSYLTTVVSLIVGIFVSLEGVYHYRDQWKNYRSTEQFLGHGKFCFVTNIEPYKDMNPENAFIKFVETIEGYIYRKNAATLNILTRIKSEEPR